MPPPSAPRERRRFPRVSLSARAVLSSRSVKDLVAGPLHDISLGGLFIKTTIIKPIGTEISLRVAVPAEGVTLLARGIVVRAVRPDEGDETALPAGMGIMFTQLDDEAQQQLERLVAAALKARATD